MFIYTACALAVWTAFGLSCTIGVLRNLEPENRNGLVNLACVLGLAASVMAFGPAVGRVLGWW